MAVVVDWLVENRVIIWESSSRVSGEEMVSGNVRVRKLIAQARANRVEKVHIFVDAFRYTYAPMSIYAMSQWFSYLREGGYGWHVICASDLQALKLCTDFAFKFMNTRIIVEDDLMRGLEFLSDRDKALPDMLQVYREWVRKPQDPLFNAHYER